MCVFIHIYVCSPYKRSIILGTILTTRGWGVYVVMKVSVKDKLACAMLDTLCCLARLLRAGCSTNGAKVLDVNPAQFSDP